LAVPWVNCPTSCRIGWYSDSWCCWSPLPLFPPPLTPLSLLLWPPTLATEEEDEEEEEEDGEEEEDSEEEEEEEEEEEGD
jgi:hypothetical protein